MIATKTVPHLQRARKLDTAPFQTSALHIQCLFSQGQGVIVLSGYGIKISVDRGHLVLEDGVGSERRRGRFARIHHNLKRVVAIGSDGFISLSAIHWMADQNICFVMLERDGTVQICTGPSAPSDARLRRAQACASHSPAALLIARELIRRKLVGQEQLVRSKLAQKVVADDIASCVQQLSAAESVDAIRQIEGKAGFAYWQAWQTLSVSFPKTDLPKVPEHWLTFGTRRSPLSKNARRASNPPNAILNYLYTMLESETRLAINALGLDPGMGLIHTDAACRDSLIYDIMEPVRPIVDGYLLDWLTRSPLKRSWFFEMPEGQCRLMSDITTQLTLTGQQWSDAVAPVSEWYVKELCARMLDMTKLRRPGTRLTQERRRAAVGTVGPIPPAGPEQQNLCGQCGAAISARRRFCLACAGKLGKARIIEVQKAGLSEESKAKKVESVRKHHAQQLNWSPSELPAWLTDEFYLARIQPLLKNLSRQATGSELGVSPSYVRAIIAGKYIPHKRHWVKLAGLVGVNEV